MSKKQHAKVTVLGFDTRTGLVEVRIDNQNVYFISKAIHLPRYLTKKLRHLKKILSIGEIIEIEYFKRTKKVIKATIPKLEKFSDDCKALQTFANKKSDLVDVFQVNRLNELTEALKKSFDDLASSRKKQNYMRSFYEKLLRIAKECLGYTRQTNSYLRQSYKNLSFRTINRCYMRIKSRKSSQGVIELTYHLKEALVFIFNNRTDQFNEEQWQVLITINRYLGQRIASFES